MSTLEEARFEIKSKDFNKAIENFAQEDERAWFLIDSRQFEIMDSLVSKEKKAKAFDGVLAAIHNIFPRANTAYCQALSRRLSYTVKKNTADMERIAKDAYLHHRGVDFMQYGKIIYDVYECSKNKANFPYREIALSFRKKQLKQENAEEREKRSQHIAELDFYLEDPQTDPVKKLSMIDEIINLAQEKYFGTIEANTTKRNYCNTAVSICRQELNDPQTAYYYLSQSKEYERRAEKAGIEWEKRRNIPTKAREQNYMYKYRSDNNER